VPSLTVADSAGGGTGGTLGGGGAGGTRLVWEVGLSDREGVNSPTVYLDARDGSLVKFDSGREGINRRIFDCTDPSDVNVCVIDSDFFQYPGYYRGRSEGQPVRGPSPFPPPFTGATDVDRAYDFVQSMQDYYLNKFGRNGGNNRGGIGNGGSVPYDHTRIFVYLDGLSSFQASCIGGGASAGTSNINFCLGSVVPDVFGHEYGHLVARYRTFNLNGTPNSLINQGESGALNESNSDIFGEAFERYMTGSTDWLRNEAGIISRNYRL
jgi:hypothetical protein